ncbi:MAG: S41 family peptidase [Phycisphaerales bacterium]|nr:S41 family peptidase [Phycisphaerales bacterium]
MWQISRFAMTGLISVSLSSQLLASSEAQDRPAAADDGNDPSAWAAKIWSAADMGDRAQVEALLADTPESLTTESEKDMDAAYELWAQNINKAIGNKSQSYDEAMVELIEHRDAGELEMALRKAVEVQSYSDEFDSALQEQHIAQLVQWAEKEIPKAESEGDWLQVQSLTFLLRTLYEDTSRTASFNAYEDALEKVNRRVSLLARYAPERLHELRSIQAERNGEDPPEPLNPATVINWQDRLDGIKFRMLVDSLDTAATEHISSSGWHPLLQGGLNSLHLVATMPSLSESFPLLAEDEKRMAWIEQIEHELAQPGDYQSWFEGRRKCLGCLNRLLETNENAVGLPPEFLYREFGDGATYELDRFSEIIWPDKVRRFQQATEGNFVGVGILIRPNEKGEIEVVNPLEGTPAYFGGIKPDDVIVEVNGEATVGWSTNDAVDRITGARGTEVELGVRREGHDDLVRLPLRRDVIKIHSVKGWHKYGLDSQGQPLWDWYIDPKDQIAYVKLTQFTAETYSDLLKALKQLSKDGQEPNGLILDLRYNPGGLLPSAVDISNLFVEEGTIVSGEDKAENPVFEMRAVESKAVLSDMPTIVLINKGSASASEIVAGCVQAHDAGLVIGERSYGKGSVQSVHHVGRSGGARFKVTTQYYRLPSVDGVSPGRLVHRVPGSTDWGVSPDIQIVMTPSQVIDSIKLRQEADIIPTDGDGKVILDSPERPNEDQLLSDGLDPQLEFALLLLKSQVAAAASQRQASLQSDESTPN